MNEEIKRLFEIFAKEVNMQTESEFIKGKGYKNDFLKIDFNSIYGGYRIDKVHKDTSESFFSESKRMGKKEMIAYLKGLLKGLELQ